MKKHLFLLLFSLVFLTHSVNVSGCAWALAGKLNGLLIPKGKTAIPVLWTPLSENNAPLAGLATSLVESQDYEATTWGRIPTEIQGHLDYNGVGLFERDGMRKRSILDGDGSIRSFYFRDGKVRFRYVMIQTQKYLEEEAAGRFLGATWTTLSSDHWFRNMGLQYGNQAGVTVLRWGDGDLQKMLAFDEMQKPYELNPHSLDTVGIINLDPERPKAIYQAHWKVDPKRNELLLFGIQPGKNFVFNVTVFDSKYNVKKRYKIELPKDGHGQYIHDWSFTDDYFVFILHPVTIPTLDLLKTVTGRHPISDTFRFSPEKGNLVWVVPRDTTQTPKGFQAQGKWVWHTANAYQKDGKIVVDFVGSDKFYGITQPDSVFTALVRGETPRPMPTNSFYRRYSIDFNSGKLAEEVFLGHGDGEFPQVNPTLSGSEHRYSYYIEHRPGRMGFNHLVQLDMKKENSQQHDFGMNEFVGEPILIPNRNGGKGWIAAPVYDSMSKRGQLAIFEEDMIGAGPIGIVYLKTHIPFTLHGRFTHD